MVNSGVRQMRDVARDLKRAGTPARGLNAKLRRNINSAVAPMKQEVQRNAFAIPAKGTAGSTGLRVALMRATRIQINTGTRSLGVRLIVDGKRMPAGQEALPMLMEGEKRWRHPVYGNREVWRDQASHPFVAPAIPKYTVAAAKGIDAALAETAAELTRGNFR